MFARRDSSSAHLFASCAEGVFGGSHAGGIVKVGTIVGHAVAGIVRDIVLVELTLPVQHIINEGAGVVQNLLLGVLGSKSAGRRLGSSRESWGSLGQARTHQAQGHSLVEMHCSRE